MSMETVERYLQELEAIKNYPQLERERNKLSRQVEKLNADLFGDKEMGRAGTAVDRKKLCGYF